jgi:hypothetical protein
MTVMGGFHYYKGVNLDKPCYPVNPGDVAYLVRTSQIKLPPLNEIRDKSKSAGSGELLIKALALLQVFWFVIQCIAKVTSTTQLSQELQQPHVTKLELLTAAYIMMALCMCLAWWNKPLNVRQPIRVPLYLEPTSESIGMYRPALVYEPPPSTSIRKYHHWYVKAAENMIFGYTCDNAYFSNGRAVPRFYTGGNRLNLDRSGSHFLIVLSLSIIFAAINCIAWHYDDKSGLSLVEVMFWRLSSFAGVGFWLISAQSLLVLAIMDEIEWIDCNSFLCTALSVWMLSFWALIYVFLRITSFVLATRELQTSAGLMLETVDWTYFIPHV